MNDVHAYNLKVASMVASRKRSYAAVSRDLLVPRDFVRYWSRKDNDPNFHPGTHGGARNLRFPVETASGMEWILWLLLKQDPMRRASDFVTEWRSLGIRVSASWVLRKFLKWRITYKKAEYIQLYETGVAGQQLVRRCIESTVNR